MSAEPQTQSTADAVSRREFLRAGGLSVVGLSLADQTSWGGLLSNRGRRNCILIQMTGGPSQFETFDPKPSAPAEIRGTLTAIDTSVPGIRISESLPLLAERAHQFQLLRSVSHSAAPLHETGLQLLQTGRLSWKGVRFPHIGTILTQATETPGFAAIAPQPLSPQGFLGYVGQDLADDDAALPVRLCEWTAQEPDTARREYGASNFGERLMQARILVEHGVRCVTVNLFDGLGSGVTWDAHGDAQCGPATIADCRDQLCPAFDQAMSGLLDDLSQRGLLEDTLVIAVGEMGRSPRINAQGGRDHWTKCWSALVAGGGTLGGQTLGASDAWGSEPAERPIHLGEIPATVLDWFGIHGRELTAIVGKQELSLIPHAPIHELWGTSSSAARESRDLATVGA